MTAQVAKRTIEAQQRITGTIGFGLFYLTIIALVVALAQWVPGFVSSQFQAWGEGISLLVFTFASIVPAMAGFYIGRTASRQKISIEKRYNGILFAIIGYWVATIVSATQLFTNLNASAIGYWIGAVLPLCGALAVLIPLGVAFSRQEQQPFLMQYKPFRLVSAGVAAALVVLAGVSIAFGAWFEADLLSSIVALFLPVVMIAMLIAFGSWLMGEKNGSGFERILKSSVALSFGLMATAFLVRFMQFNPALASYGIVIGVVVWIVYIYYVRKYPSIQK